MTRQRRSQLLFIVAIVAIGQFIGGGVLLWQHGAPGLFGGDFLASYAATHIVATTGWQHIYDLAVQQAAEQDLLLKSGLNLKQLVVQPYNNPPIELLLAIPFANIAPSLAVALWVAANAVLSVVGMLVAVAAARRIAPTAASPLTPFYWGLLSFAFLPISWGLLAGQPIGLMLLLFAIALWALPGDRPWLGGVALALLAFIKPQVAIGPLLFLLVTRRWQAASAALAAGCVLLLGCFLLVGWDGMLAYATMLRGIESFRGNATVSITAQQMVNWRAVLSYFPGLSASVGVAASLALGGVTFVTMSVQWRHIRSTYALPLELASFTAGGLLASYHSHLQDCSLLFVLVPALATQLRAASFEQVPAQRTYTIVLAALWGMTSATWLVLGVLSLALLPAWITVAIPALTLLTFGIIPLWRATLASHEPAARRSVPQIVLPIEQRTGQGAA